MTAEEDPMPQHRHHPYARARAVRPTYAHDELLKLVDSSDQTPMDVSDSEMASDDQTGGAICTELEDMDLDMNKASDGLSMTMDPENGFVTQHVFEKYKELQAQLLKKDQELCTLQATIDSTPFACVLVDGDGAVFLEEYINQGEKGGKIAGDKLYDGIKKYLQTDGELWRLGITNIMVQVYLNVDGLGRALQNAGLLDSQHTDPSRQLTLFGRGFNKAQMFFSFIDVGREKEAADHKIRAVFELMERNLHCKCLILAGYHDGGYGRLLDTYEFKYRCQPPSHKIRLLETTPTPERSVYRTAQYLDAFPRLTLPEVFRSEKVDTSQQVYNGNSWTVPRISYHPWNSSEHFTPQRTPSSGSLYNPTSLTRAPETNRHSTRDSDILGSLLSSLDDAATGDVCISTEDDHAATAGRFDPFSSCTTLLDSSSPVDRMITSSSSSSALASIHTIPSISKSLFYSQPNTILPPRTLFPQDLNPSSSPFPRPVHLNNNLLPSVAFNDSQPTNQHLQAQDFLNTLVQVDRRSHEVQERYMRTQPWQHLLFQLQVQQPNERSQYPHQRVYYLNQYGQRIDSPIKAPSDTVKKDLKNLGHETIEGPDKKFYFTGRERRFCNKYHISGSCPDGDRCKYIHDLRLPKSPLTDKLLTEDGLLTDELLTAIRYNARNLKCGRRWGCRDVDCHMGHHCFNPSTCDFPTCKFTDAHNVLVDLNPAWKVYHDGRVESVDEFGPSGQ